MKRILVIDDDPSVARLIDATLKKLGFEYVLDYCSDGAQGRLKAINKPYDLLLLDLAMPFMDGLEALKEIKSNPRSSGTAVVIITAIKEVEKHQAARRLGAAAILTKPFAPGGLAATICQALEPNRIQSVREPDDVVWRD